MLLLDPRDLTGSGAILVLRGSNVAEQTAVAVAYVRIGRDAITLARSGLLALGTATPQTAPHTPPQMPRRTQRWYAPCNAGEIVGERSLGQSIVAARSFLFTSDGTIVRIWTLRFAELVAAIEIASLLHTTHLGATQTSCCPILAISGDAVHLAVSLGGGVRVDGAAVHGVALVNLNTLFSSQPELCDWTALRRLDSDGSPAAPVDDDRSSRQAQRWGSAAELRRLVTCTDLFCVCVLFCTLGYILYAVLYSTRHVLPYILYAVFLPFHTTRRPVYQR